MSKKEINILLIGCDDTLQHRLLEVLGDRYALKSIRDMEQGIKKAIKIIPDIILIYSNSLYEEVVNICLLLKDHQLSSHIPIILILYEKPAPPDIHSLPADAVLSFTFSKKELMLGLQKVISIKIQLMKRYPLFYDPENAFTREYSLLSNYIDQLTDG